MAGYEWYCATTDAAFEPRDGAGLLSFKGRLWMLGGWNPWNDAFFPHPQCTNSEVWSSADGASWTLEAHAPWPSRHCAGWLVHDDGDGEKLFVVSGDASPPVGYDTDVWRSCDGREWTLVLAQTPWSPRAGQMTVSFDGFMWMMGGQTKGDPDSTVGFVAGRADEIVDGKSKAAAIPTVNAGAEAGSETAFNDVWRSRTGAEWECVTSAAAWSPRAWVGGSAVLGGRMFVIGGGFIGGYDPSTDTVGYIQDTLVYPEPKPTRPSYNDVWSSANGVDWVCHCRHAAFRRRHYHEIMSWDNKLWVLEGYNGHPHLYAEEVAAGASELPVVGSEGNRNDVWYSSDGGTNWHELPDTPWPKRHAASVTVHDDALWIAVGNTDWSGNPKLQGADGYHADVWALHRSSLASKL